MSYVVKVWRQAHPDTQIPDGQIFTQPWPAGPTDQRRDHVIYYQYRADRARSTLRGIDEQVAKAEKAVAGKTAVKRNRFVRLSGGTVVPGAIPRWAPGTAFPPPRERRLVSGSSRGEDGGPIMPQLPAPES